MVDPATDCLSTILHQYTAARSGEAMTPHHPVLNAFANLQRWLEGSGAVQDHPNVKVRWSAGVGKWAKVPWVALLDGRETSSTQRGLYCSLLFRTDMQGAYLALEQGKRELGRALGPEAAQRQLMAQGEAMRQEMGELGQAGFVMHGQIDLGDLEQTHQHQVVAHKYYVRDALPTDADLAADLVALVQAYQGQLAARDAGPTVANAWLFQANPQVYNLRSALGSKEFTWPVRQHGDSMRAGDRVYFWESGAQGGLVGVGALQGVPESMSIDAVSRRAMRKSPPPGEALRVWVRPEMRLPQGVARAHVLAQTELANMAVVRTPMAVNFELTGQEQRALERLLQQAASDMHVVEGRQAVTVGPQPRMLSEALTAALRAARLHVSPGLEMQLHALVAALLTRPCSLVLGPSGCGKTQLGLRLAEFWGVARGRVVAVPRGDAQLTWLLGEATGPVAKGRQMWTVPPLLQLLYKAAADARQPYLLVLDNVPASALHGKLADWAACVDGGLPCLPALKRDPDGTWRATLGQSVPWPVNVSVLALCNSETPATAWHGARLDPWGLVPWVATADDVPPRYAAPEAAPEATPELLRAWLHMSQDATWHDSYLDSDAGRLVAAKVMDLGRLCDALGMPMGHRFFATARRFAALFAETAQATSLQCVDQIMAMHVVPRLLLLHPEVPVGSLLRYTFDLSPNGQGDYDPWGAVQAPACLPRSHAALLGRV